MTAFPAGWLRAGRVGRPHGLDGSFHVNQPNDLLLVAGAQVRIGSRSWRIVERASRARRFIVRLEGMSTRTEAEAVRGAELLVAREEAPQLGEQEWWAEDLEGCAVRDGERRLGSVRRMVNLPSCEVPEVLRPDGSELLVPLVRDAVRQVDVAGRWIDVDSDFLGEPG